MTSMMDNDDNHDDNPPETFFLLSRQHWGRILSVHSHQGWPDLIIAIMMLMIVISFSVKIYALVQWAHPVFILLCTRCALGVDKKELSSGFHFAPVWTKSPHCLLFTLHHSWHWQEESWEQVHHLVPGQKETIRRIIQAFITLLSQSTAHSIRKWKWFSLHKTCLWQECPSYHGDKKKRLGESSTHLFH